MYMSLGLRRWSLERAAVWYPLVFGLWLSYGFSERFGLLVFCSKQIWKLLYKVFYLSTLV